MAVTTRTLRLQRQIQRDLKKITDQQTRDLVSAWANAWDEVAPDLTAVLVDMLVAGDRVTRTQLLRSTRLRKALTVIAGQLETLAADAGVRIVGDLREVIDQAGGAQASVIDSQLPPNSDLLDGLDSWSRVDERQIAAMVNRSTQQITSRTKPLSAEAYDVVRRELLRGVASGTNPRATAARMVTRARKGFNGGLTRALTIARTETLDVHRAAAQLAQAEHVDVLAGWIWTADLSARVCPACLSMHGTRHPLSDPGPLGHQNCRCARVPVVKTWAELGFTGITEPESLMPDGASWFNGLDSGTQLQILGPTRYVAYQNGTYPMSSWATRRSTPGWRDSYVVSAAPQSGGRRSFNAA
ncbi:phage minor head protein [Nocardioides sp. PD653]|uniref:phage minor head protein n=1 Tax=Nocardioides sp. PD653 TaxID=393303 RepID=UPI0009F0AFC6|nr:phage minor head protein [Nocardioides sp. PD653]GAW54736.1 Phage head morphogenesis protein, SPP1 gp7 family [Nocardioides sp. PD653]